MLIDQAINTDEVEEEEKKVPEVRVTFEEPPEEVKAPSKAKKAPKKSKKKPSKRPQLEEEKESVGSKSAESEGWPEYNPADFEESKASKMQTRSARRSSASAEKENKRQPQLQMPLLLLLQP